MHVVDGAGSGHVMPTMNCAHIQQVGVSFPGRLDVIVAVISINRHGLLRAVVDLVPEAAAGAPARGGGADDPGRAGAAAVRVLQRDVPGRGGPGARRPACQVRRRRDAPRGPAPAPLPRLFRRRVRRHHHAQVPQRDGAAGRGPQLDGARVRGHRGREGQGGGGVPAGGVLRRHHGHGRARRRELHQGPRVPGGDRAARRQRVPQGGRAAAPAPRRRQRHRADALFRRPEFDDEGHGGAVGGAHPRRRALPVLLRTPVQLHRRRRPGPVAGRGVRQEPDGGVLVAVRRGQRAAAGPGVADHLRHGVLQIRVQPPGAAGLRRCAAGGQPHRRLRQAHGHQRLLLRRHLLRRLRRLHDQHGQDRRAHRHRRRRDQGYMRRLRRLTDRPMTTLAC
uniref:Uncharacterized protein n=1 Tax=Zea mays TaxID=4577 RepID=A0A804UCH7_MAIZE